MLNFPTRSSQPEILDDFELKGNDLSENLYELEKVNRLLGGYAIVREGIQGLVKNKNPDAPVRIVDVGCGGGDALRMLSKWGRKQGLAMKLTGVDANPSAVQFASKRTETVADVNFEVMDILSPEFRSLKADIVMFNLFLHHFREDQIIEFIKSCKSNGSAILINDLQRSRLAYQAFRLASRGFRFSYISRHDGKLSVRKSFTKKDWERIMKKAGVTRYSLSWRWAFRYLVLIP